MPVRLAVNALFGVQLAALGELMGFIQQVGLDQSTAVQILTATPVCSPAAKLAAESMQARKFSPLFPIELVEKDFAYILETALTHGAKVPLAGAVQKVFNKAIEKGFGKDNITGVAQLYLK